MNFFVLALICIFIENSLAQTSLTRSFFGGLPGLSTEKPNDSEELISDFNGLASLGSVYAGKNRLVKKKFLQQKYIEFYEKWKNSISNRFNNWNADYEKK